MKLYFLQKKYIVLIITIIPLLVLEAQSNKEKAVNIANKVLEAMGGVKNYNNTKFIQWNFAKRTLYWNKWNGDVRIENPEKNLVILINVNNDTGKAYEYNKLITDEEKTKKLLEKGKKWWINDTYWLVMPWKLKDPGVTLSYIKEDTLPNGKTAHVLQLTFADVGVTPNNKYLIYVDQEDNLIKQWEFFKNFNDAKAKFSRPWDNYQKAGNILLSFNRSEFGPTDVIVKQKFNSKIFKEL